MQNLFVFMNRMMNKDTKFLRYMNDNSLKSAPEPDRLLRSAFYRKKMRVSVVENDKYFKRKKL